MTYTINNAVDVNATVDIGNIQVSTNTISSTNTNGNIIIDPNGSGKVGVGTASPSTLFTMEDTSTNYTFLQINGQSGWYTGIKISRGSGNWSTDEDNTFGFLVVDAALTFEKFTAKGDNVTGRSTLMTLTGEGLLGIGNNSPKSRLHVETFNSGQSLTSGNRRYFRHDVALTSDTGVFSLATASIYASGDIVSSGYLLSHSSTTFSDARIKNTIVDVDDDSALTTLRLIKPKQYKYTDTVMKGTETVWGFIAQEVKSTMDYAVSTTTKEIPNIFKDAGVTNGNILVFSDFNTSSLVNDTQGSLVSKLLLKTWSNKEIEVEIESVLDSSRIKISSELLDEDINGNIDSVAVTNSIFVYGQIVDDFHVLKKDAIFTLGIAAMQEIDRRQTTDNQRILELETLVDEQGVLIANLTSRLDAAGL